MRESRGRDRSYEGVDIVPKQLRAGSMFLGVSCAFLVLERKPEASPEADSRGSHPKNQRLIKQPRTDRRRWSAVGVIDRATGMKRQKDTGV